MSLKYLKYIGHSPKSSLLWFRQNLDGKIEAWDGKLWRRTSYTNIDSVRYKLYRSYTFSTEEEYNKYRLVEKLTKRKT